MSVDVEKQLREERTQRAREAREARAKMIGDLAAEIRRMPLTGAELSRLFDKSLAAAPLQRFYDEDEGCGCTERSQNSLDNAVSSLGRRDYREALYQIGRAIPELSDLSYLADRLTIAPGA